MNTRKPAVADMFYPGHPGTLGEALEGYLANAETPPIIPKAIIAPHAGYVYSGPVAASAFRLLEPIKDRISRVVLVGPSHRVRFYGIATSSYQGFETPLGDIPLDREAIDDLLKLQTVTILDKAHAQEHALEVLLPFLQKVLNSFSLIPLVVGQASCHEVAEALDRVWGGEETLICISSDLSHYLDYETAREKDRRTSEAIQQLCPEDIEPDDACGRLPIQGLLLGAARRELTAHRLDLRNSGDTAGSRDQVVGYGAFAFTEP